MQRSAGRARRWNSMRRSSIRCLTAAIQESLPPEPRNPVQAALREVDRRLVVEWLSQYREQVEKYDAQWKDFSVPMAPELFEVSFGRGERIALRRFAPTEAVGVRRRRAEPSASPGGSTASTPACSPARACSTCSTTRPAERIRLTPESIAAGTTLQLPLYAIAAMELIADRPRRLSLAGRLLVRARRRLQAEAGAEDVRRASTAGSNWIAKWEDIRDGLAAIPWSDWSRSMRAGRFPVCSADDHCTGRCPFSTVCRINQVRSLEKTWQPTAEAE